MKVSRTWLQRYFTKELPSIEKLRDALTFHAFEIEEIYGDVLEVKVLPDRAGYALSHRGIAKELSAILSIPMKLDPLRESLPQWKTTPALSIKTDTAYVLRHMGALMKGVHVGPSPKWLRETLESVGQRSINNIVDATNFVMLDIGQPTHAFDSDRIENKGGILHIDIREAKVGEEITVLTGETYILVKKMYVIADRVSGAALDIAGVKGGVTSGISESTKNLFISVGNYDGELIRKMSQSLSLMTDASNRYQHRPSPELTAYGMHNLVALIKEVAGGELEGVVDEYNKKPAKQEVSMTLEKVTRLLGAAYSEHDVESVLQRLDLPFEKKDGAFTVTPSFERTDLSISEDLVEEVGRIIGYDRVLPKELPNISAASFPVTVRTIEAIKDLLVTYGFNEVSTYIMLDRGDLSLLKPLAEDKKYLRTDLAHGHAKAVALNSVNVPLLNLSDLRLFEIGRCWPMGEEKHLLGVTYWSQKKEAKKKREELFTEIQGALKNLLGKDVEGTVKDNTLEFDVDTLLTKGHVPETTYSLSQEGMYHPFSLYPFALRDVAVWTPEETEPLLVEKRIREHGGTLLKRCDLSDVYKKDGKISYMYKLVLQAEDRTLTDTELDSVMQNITRALNANNGWSVR